MRFLNRKKSIILITFISIVMLGVSLWLFTSVGDVVKRQTALIMKTEYIPIQNMTLESRDVFTQKDSTYKNFRDHFRFHFQTIALAHFPDSSKLIVISEPPPYFEVDSIKSIFAEFNHSVEIVKHPMGYDGFVKDIVISIANATDENINLRVKKLSKLLYLSDYKPVVTSLPVQEDRVYFSKENLDYQISLYEFNQWFIEDQEVFIDLKDTTQKFTIDKIFKTHQKGVFFSENPGFVAWAIEKKSDLKDQLNFIRQFTLDADLILGALADSSMLVIIGREREASLATLPPLQVESILLLASVTEKELSQSLDVNDFLAGKMKSGRDWCPTYLSKELENTEFGHLMTITDIFLKDWSENGTIQEFNYRYPEPPYYPFQQPLFKMLGINELVYNWNTADAMYAIDLDQVTIYTLNRTGSLPVSYFNSPESGKSIGRSYEKKAYNYFSTLGNTELARVVQYTALYQLFMDNGISYKGETYNAFPKNKPYLLLSPVKNVLELFKTITDQQISFVTDSVTDRTFQGYHKSKLEEQLSKNEQQYNFTYTAEQKVRIIEDYMKNYKESLRKEFVSVRNLLKKLPEAELNLLAKQLAYPRGERINTQEKYQIFLKSKKLRDLINHIGKRNLDLLGINLQDVKNYFVNSLGGSSAKYLKTPSAIITFNDFYTTGGHNLSSKISRVKTMKNYKKSSSAGNDYVADNSTPSNNNPQTAKPTTTKSKTSNTKSTKTTTTTTTSKPAPKSTPTVRKRTAVIPATQRGQRGL